MIIDSQVHIWAAETPDRPWYSPTSHLPNPFGYMELLEQMESTGVAAAVLVPPGWEGGRNDLALEGAGKYPDRFAVMGRIALDDPGAPALLPQWKARQGMLGIRLALQKQAESGWLDDGTTDWFWPEAEKFDIPLMVFAPGRNEALSEIARAHPKLRMIVDHMNLNREQDGDAAAAIESLIPLADHPNLHVKVSSVPLYSTEPYPYRNLHRALARLIAAFGARRAFWGTDLTRIWTLVESYRQCVTLFTEELDFLTADDLDWVMGRGLAQCLAWKIGD
ncbi:MAG: amidohydrolase family protein [Alphaproteobacteria bacterium]